MHWNYQAIVPRQCQCQPVLWSCVFCNFSMRFALVDCHTIEFIQAQEYERLFSMVWSVMWMSCSPNDAL